MTHSLAVIQAAFKRPPPCSDHKGGLQQAMPEWDNVKTEDRTLVYQVQHKVLVFMEGLMSSNFQLSLCMSCSFSCCITSMRKIL